MGKPNMGKPMMGKITLSIISIVCIIFLSVASWVSCSSSVQPNSTRSARSGSTTSSSSSTADDDEDVEECSDRESCEDECNKIYSEYAEKNECEDLDIDEVVDLGRVYNALHNGRLNDLEKISDEKDDVDKSMFADYLEIGVSGWVAKIKCWGGDTDIAQSCSSSKPDKIKTTLKWLIDEEDVASTLQGHDDANEVIKQLVLNLKESYNIPTITQALGNRNSIGREGKATNDVKCASSTSDPYKRFSTAGSGNDLQICKNGTDGEELSIGLKNSNDKKLYDALSITWLGSNYTLNIFSYSADKKDEGGTDVFKSAFSLLDGVCEEISGGDDKVRCRRAMMCWTHFQTEPNLTANYDKDFDNLLENNYKSDLEGSGASNYDDCDASHFNDI